MEFIYAQLLQNRDDKYAQFTSSLSPTMDPASVIGVRTPVLRAMAKELARDDRCEAFLQELPHTWFEEKQLHGFLISGMKDFDTCIEKLELFLPYIDNWATCDQTSPKVFKKNKEKLLPYIYKWLQSDHTYTVRFAIGMLMQHYLDEDFRTEYLDLVTAIRSDEYYINMEIAWYLATALAKQWDATIPYIETQKLGKWVQNKTIQKARESFRVTAEHKEYLKTLKM